jgi:hypothetical protein
MPNIQRAGASAAKAEECSSFLCLSERFAEKNKKIQKTTSYGCARFLV